jgi:hypothetical protein
MTDLIFEAEYLNALAAGYRRSRREPRALAVAYDADRDAIVITMAEGWRIDIDRARNARNLRRSPAALAHLCRPAARLSVARQPAGHPVVPADAILGRTYWGFSQTGPMSGRLKQTFYYPRGFNSGRKRRTGDRLLNFLIKKIRLIRKTRLADLRLSTGSIFYKAWAR